MPDFDMYKAYQKPVLCVAAKNIPEFYALIEKAKEQADALQKTVDELNRFYFDLEISTTNAVQAGGMEEASSITSVIPTK